MKKGKTNFRETVHDGIVLLEQTDDRPGRRIRGIGAVADVVNLNRRRYPEAVLREAASRAQALLGRSLSNGYILGEADHPTDKPRLLSVVTKWEAITFNETSRQVELEGRMIPNSAGRDVIVMMESGVLPGISLRGYGASFVDEEGIEEVTDLTLTGFDLVFEPSFEAAGVTVFEQHREGAEGAMNEEEIKDGAQTVVAQPAKPDAKLTAELEEQKRQREAAEKALAEAQRKQAENDAVAQKREAEIAERMRKLEEQAAVAEQARREAEVRDAIREAAGALPYGNAVREQLVKAVEASKPQTVEEARAAVTSRQSEYGAVTAAEKARAMGLNVTVVGPVIEQANGQPAYVEFAETVREELRQRGLVERNERRDLSPAGQMAKKVLAAYDKAYRSQLIQEHNARREWQEALATTDLNLPYSINRAVIAEAVPELVAANLFDFGTIEGSPTRVWFSAYAGETGSAPAVVDEVVTSDEGAWVALANKYIRRGTVVVTNSAGSTTYTEWTDYRIDHQGGRLFTVTGGAIGDSTSLKVDYTYDDIATGEGGAIERGKTSLTYQDVSVAALRIAVLINDEASALGMTQLGWDAQARAISSLIGEVREKIDQAVFDVALIAAVSSGNNGGSWTAASDTEADLVKKLGVAATAVRNDYYNPTAFVMSKTNADRLSNWTGLTREGFPDALLGSAGFENMQVKGLPVFSSTEMPDSHILVVNRELVQHRVLASRPMALHGPFQFRNSDGKLTAQKEWYIEQYSGQWAFVNNKGGYVRVI